MRPKWTFAVVSTALFMVVLDNLVVTTALPSIRAELGATIESLEWTVNAYTLSFAVLLLTGAALGDRFGRRRMFVIGVSALHGRLGGRRARPDHRRADRRPRASRAPAAAIVAAAHADPALRRRSPPAAAGSCSASGRASPASPSRSARWSAAPSSTASRGTGSSGSTCRSASRSSRSRARFLTESLGPARQLDLPGLALGGLGLLGIVYGIVRGNELGWTRARDRRLAGRRRRARGRVRRLGAARPAPDAADALLPLPRVRGGQRRRLHHVLRRLRLDLPAGAVPAGHAGPLAAGGRACGRSRGRRCRCSIAPIAGHPVRPDRLAAADGDRPRAAGGALAWLARDLGARRRLLRRSCSRSRWPDRAWRSCSRPRPTRCSARSTSVGRPGLGRHERDPRARRRDGDRRAGHRCSPATAPTRRRRPTRTAWSAPSGSAPRCSPPAR